MASLVSATRVLSIDAFRGITIFTMVFVNELAQIQHIPQWLKHYPADVDGMSVVDLVFPAFLFIVGMSIPFAVEARRAKGASYFTIYQHLLVRSASLLVIGFFMVNTESGYDANAMPISIPLWIVLMYTSVLCIWLELPKRLSSVQHYAIRAVGLIGLFILYFIYQGNDGGNMTPQWWGILGLIGWAYLIAGSIFLICRRGCKGKLLVPGLLGCCLVLLAFHALLSRFADEAGGMLQLLAQYNGHYTHAAIVLFGIIVSLSVYGTKAVAIFKNKIFSFCGVGVIALLCGLGFWLVFPISKIWATPSWSMMSAFYCVLIFATIYLLIDIFAFRKWTKFFQPAAKNPLLVYLIPFILSALAQLCHIQLRPDMMNEGALGIIWSFIFACMVMLCGALLNRQNLFIKL